MGVRHIGPLLGVALLAALPAHAQVKAADAKIAAANAAMFADPRAALDAASGAERAVAGMPGEAAHRTLIKARWLEGEALSRLNRDAEAEPLIRRTLHDAGRRWPQTTLYADLLMTWGGISQNRNRAAEALAAFQQAHNLFRDLHEPRKQAVALVMIASLYNNAKDNASALRYFGAALEAYDSDRNLSVSIYNNRGNVLLDLKRPAEASLEYRKALKIARALQAPRLMVPVLDNLARAELAMGRLASAQRYIKDARDLVQGRTKDLDAQLDAVSARIALGQGDLDQAVIAIDRAFDNVGDVSSLAWREAHRVAVDVYTRAGRPGDALTHLTMLKRIDDDVTKLAADTNTALLAARFDATNQQLRIEKLKTNEANQRARYESDRSFFQLLLVGGILFVALAGAGLLAFALFHIHRSRARVRIANLDLAATNDELGKALAAKREFLATTSHEFRTPLNGILGMSQVLLADPEMSEQARERVGLLHDAGKSMQSMVEDVLDMAMLDSGKAMLVHVPLDLRGLLTDVARQWQDEASARRINFVSDVAACPGMIEGDARRIHQIISQLLSNAFKFTHEGGVALLARRAADGSSAVEISVTDTGIGIPAHQHGRIFDKFHQVNGGTSRHYGGIGLGLAVARNLARAMGGNILVESEVGAGATFRLLLPIKEPARRDSSGTQRRLCEGMLLVVEANRLKQGVTAHSLKQVVGAVEFVATIGEAHLRIAQGGVDFLLVQAEEAAEPGELGALVDAAKNVGVGTILLFAMGGMFERSTLEEMGAALVLTKPIGMPALASALKTLDGDASTLAA